MKKTIENKVFSLIAGLMAIQLVLGTVVFHPAFTMVAQAAAPGLTPREKKSIIDAAMFLRRKGFRFIDQNRRELGLLDLMTAKKNMKVFTVPPRNTAELNSDVERAHAYWVDFDRHENDDFITVTVVAYRLDDLVNPVSFRSLNMKFFDTPELAAAESLRLQQALLSLEIELCGCANDPVAAAEKAKMINELRGRVNLISTAVMLTGAASFLSGALVLGMSTSKANSWFGRLLVIGGLAALVGGAVKIYVNEENF